MNEQVPSNEHAFTFTNVNQEPFLILHSDGRITVGPHVTADEAAQRFLDSLRENFPAWLSGLRSAHEPRGDWWCETCKAIVAPDMVTHDETHDLRYGGCGQHVFVRAAQPPASEPTWPHPYGYIRGLLSEAVERAEADLMAVGHGQDGPDRTAAMKDLENWKAKLQDAWIHGDLEVRRASQPPPAEQPEWPLITRIKADIIEHTHEDPEDGWIVDDAQHRATLDLLYEALQTLKRQPPPPAVSDNPNEGPIVHGYVQVIDGVLPPFHNHWSCLQCGRRAEYVKENGCPESCGRVATSTKGKG